jgi:hypothetical protein
MRRRFDGVKDESDPLRRTCYFDSARKECHLHESPLDSKRTCENWEATPSAFRLLELHEPVSASRDRNKLLASRAVDAKFALTSDKFFSCVPGKQL